MIYVFIQVYPVTHVFDKILCVTEDKLLVDRIISLIDTAEVFKKSFERLDSAIIHSISDKEMEVVNEVNHLLGSSLDWVDELLIQETNKIL